MAACLQPPASAHQLQPPPCFQLRANSSRIPMTHTATSHFLRAKPTTPQRRSAPGRSVHVTAAAAPFFPFPPVPSVSLSSAKYERAGYCFVYPPVTKPKAVLHFLGGAFVGKTPDVFYSYFLELLVDAGFLVLVTPYDVTFDHTACVEQVRSRFAGALEILNLRGLPDASLEPGEASFLPVFGVGHSNGALLQILSGTREPISPLANVDLKGNVIIAYNNRPASEAVPYFNLVGPTVRQIAPLVEQGTSALQTVLSAGPGIILAAAEQALETFERSRNDLPQVLPEEVTEPLGRFADQLGPVFGQVQEGVSEFTPAPAENLKTVKESYSVPSTLLIQFSVDSIDETPALEAALRARLAAASRLDEDNGWKIEKILLNGTHATPLAPDVLWEVGPAFTPADAVAVALKAAALEDIRGLARTVISWLTYNL